MPDDLEALALRPSVIAGHRCADDYGVIFRGMAIGRIMKASGVPGHVLAAEHRFGRFYDSTFSATCDNF
jgi:hypothetical protein